MTRPTGRKNRLSSLLDKHGMTLAIPSAGVRFPGFRQNRDFAGIRSGLEPPGTPKVRFPMAPGVAATPPSLPPGHPRDLQNACVGLQTACLGLKIACWGLQEACLDFKTAYRDLKSAFWGFKSSS